MMDSAALLEQAARLHRQGNLAEAVRGYEQTLQGDPNNADALYGLAQANCQQGRFAEGATFARRVLTVEPHRAQAHVLLGRALLELGSAAEALASFDRAIACRGDLADAYGNRGDVLAQLGRLPEALLSYQRALELDPDSIANLCNLGAVQIDLGRLGDALASYDRLVALEPGFAEGHFNRGNTLLLLERHQEAVGAYDAALGINPNAPDVLNNRGNALRRLGRTGEALASFERALALSPDHVAALVSHGDMLRTLERPEEALRSYERALGAMPREINALMGRAAALAALKRTEEALASLDAVLAVDPSNVDALSNRGFLLHSQDRNDEALAHLERALACDPSNAAALLNRGVVLADIGRHTDAIASYDRVIAIAPEHIVAHCNRSKSLSALHRYGEAMDAAHRALAIDPTHAEALFEVGKCCMKLKREPEAIVCFERVRAIDPGHRHVDAALASCHLAICDWGRTSDLTDDLKVHIEEGRSVIPPFILLGYPFGSAELLKCTRTFLANTMPRVAAAFPPRVPTGGKIKLAYLSADFRAHATAYLAARLFELHDRSAFEVIGISFGRNEQSAMRTRLAQAFDRFYDVSSQDDGAVARLLRETGVDIAVDLKGHTEDARPGILASRPAPVQVSYLGYPATMGVDFIDYIIADPIVLPHDQQPHFSERIVHLPGSYQVNDDRRPIASVRTRREEGLPERGLVFCCFNNNWKINPPVFDVWMRILAAVDGSVIWLLKSSEVAADNLRREAQARGVDPARLIFAPFRELPEHLARMAHASLFLDTLPCNAHTTASDALWAGLPVLTCLGDTFAGRVAASLLHAVGMPELVTTSLADYEALALALARDPARLAAIRDKLHRNRLTEPLFDTDRFRRDIESAYRTMWDIHRRGQSPRSFSVAATQE